MSNYSILQQNTLAGLSETAGCLYLKLLDVFEAHRSRANEIKAFLAACHYDEAAGNTLDYIMRNSPAHNLTGETLSALSSFFAERWRNNFLDAAPAKARGGA